MKFGHFDDERKEYVIETPFTPLPWINYLGDEDFFGLISNTGGGYNFYKDAKLRRITRCRYNNVPTDSGGRCFYIADGKTFFSPAFLPAKTKLDRYECRHGLGYTLFSAQKDGVCTKLLCFVPRGDRCEIQQLTLTNASGEKKSLKIFAAAEWCLWNAVDDTTNFQRNYSTGEVEIEPSVLYHKTEYRERRNHFAFYSVNERTCGFDTDRDTFLGKFNGFDSPAAVTGGHCFHSVASGWSPIACHELSVELAPGERKTLIFLLGYTENAESEKWEAPGIINKKKAHALIAKYSSEIAVGDALYSLKKYWEKLLSVYSVSSPDEKLDRMVNIWNQYQCMVTFNMSRSASYYESGIGRGMGFRDSCQDLLGFVHMIPDRARERIIDIASIQKEDGSTWHQYQPLTKRGNADAGGGFNDDPLWLIACTYAYVSETGDMGILFEQVPFDNDENNQAPLFEHLRRSLDFTLTHIGPHGLPLIGRADWNDCLNLNCFSKEPGESFQTTANFESGKAESVFIAGMFVRYGEQYARLCEKAGDKAEAERIRKETKKMAQATQTAGWDGDWFVRAYDAFSQPVGSKICEEGKIYIEPQGMCVMAGIGKDNSMAEKALKSVEKYLETPYGIVILQPAYKTYHLNLGEVSSYPPGYKENAGIFCHNNPWISCAEAELGHGDRAFEVYRKICPAYLEEISEIHRTEPYVYSQMIAGKDSPHFGEAKNSWLTGTAAWTFVNVSQALLGITPTPDGLEINPCMPSQINEFRVTRKYSGCTYTITAKRGTEYSLIVNGERMPGNVIAPVRAKTANAEVTFR